MSITREELARIAALAALDVDDAALPELVTQVSRILEYVSQLGAVAADDVPPFRPPSHAEAQPLREDVVRPGAALDPRAFAPQFAEGLFLVPRVGGFGEGDAA